MAKDDEKTGDAKAPPDADAKREPDRKSATEPIVAADGHVVLSQEDIDNRA